MPWRLLACSCTFLSPSPEGVSVWSLACFAESPRASEPKAPVRRVTASLCPRTGLHSGLASRSRARGRDLRRTHEGGRLPFRLHGGPRLGSCVPAVTPEWKPGSIRDDVANARLAPSQDGGCDSDASPHGVPGMCGFLCTRGESLLPGMLRGMSLAPHGQRCRRRLRGATVQQGCPPGSSLRCACSQR